MILNVDHIGIAVSDLSNANALFEKLLGKGSYKEETVESEGVTTSFFRTGETKVELVQSAADNDAIAKFIEKRGEGIHHIAFEVDDILAEMKRLTSEGFTLLSDKPKEGADNKLIVFLHPKETNGVLIELCQTKK